MPRVKNSEQYSRRVNQLNLSHDILAKQRSVEDDELHDTGDLVMWPYLVKLLHQSE